MHLRNSAVFLLLLFSFVLFKIVSSIAYEDSTNKLRWAPVWSLLGWVILLSIYRLSFHPLAKYPGPWLAAVTDWYTVVQIGFGGRHLDLYRLHKKHGTFVRYGPNRVSINSANALRDIYAVNANVQKSKAYSTYKHFFGKDMSMTMTDRKEHASRRRIHGRAQRPEAIEAMQEKIIHNVRIFCASLVESESPNNWSSAKNLTKIVGYLVSDIMGDITFSRNWNTQKDPQYRHFVEDSALGTAGIHLTGHMPSLFKFHLHHVLFRPLANGIQQLNLLTTEITKWRLKQGDTLAGTDLFSTLLEAKDPLSGREFTTAELISEAGLLVVAGTDTTITTTSATFYYLLTNPAHLMRALEEVRGLFHSVEDIRVGARLDQCQFLRACIDETLRLTPPIGSILPREVLPGGIVVEGEAFAEGVDLGVPHYALHHNEEYFSRPADFRPERWLESEGGVAAQSHPAFASFGVGRTSCIGQYLAYQEISIVIGRVLWLYDIRLDPNANSTKKHNKQFPTLDRFVSTHDGPMVQFRYRD